MWLTSTSTCPCNARRRNAGPTGSQRSLHVGATRIGRRVYPSSEDEEQQMPGLQNEAQGWPQFARSLSDSSRCFPAIGWSMNPNGKWGRRRPGGTVCADCGPKAAAELQAKSRSQVRSERVFTCRLSFLTTGGRLSRRFAHQCQSSRHVETNSGRRSHGLK